MSSDDRTSAPSTKSTSAQRSSRKPTSGKGVLIGVIVAVAALLAGWLSQLAVDDSGGGGTASNQTIETEEENDGGSEALKSLARRDADDPFARGDKDAPVVLIEYADFGCSFCGKFARDTEPKLVEKYVKKGVLRMEWRNFTVFGKGSERAALAGWAAGQQDRFWEFYDAVYADKGSEKSDFSDEELHKHAEEAGISDLDRFDRDRKSDAAEKAVNKDQEEAYGLGANSTPVFLVNGQPIAGAQPDEAFTDAIEKAAEQEKKKSEKKSEDNESGEGSDSSDSGPDSGSDSEDGEGSADR